MMHDSLWYSLAAICGTAAVWSGDHTDHRGPAPGPGHQLGPHTGHRRGRPAHRGQQRHRRSLTRGSHQSHRCVAGRGR